jgi:hypothetical protein
MKTPSKNPKLTKPLAQHTAQRKRRRTQFVRFKDAKGKTVEFVEMYTSADFPCVEIGFADKTALHFLIDTRLTMEPTYSNWKTGNQRMLRRWPAVDCR